MIAREGKLRCSLSDVSFMQLYTVYYAGALPLGHPLGTGKGSSGWLAVGCAPLSSPLVTGLGGWVASESIGTEEGGLGLSAPLPFIIFLFSSSIFSAAFSKRQGGVVPAEPA